ncbi:MAG: bifunctional nuclease family protein [Bacteroidales bacterium]|jgi:bifunctional DNase/RNase|nr:bifunctional nuclease family protein [Bacteroidales bacterium]
MAKIAVKIDYIFKWRNDYTQILILKTQDNQVSLPIIIADFEAVGLLKEIEKIDVKRPQTHDLFFSMMQSFNIHLEEVYMHKLVEGIFYTKLICSAQGKMIEFDSRPSDAIILALKAKAPIFVDDSILGDLGMSADEIDKQIFQLENENENTVSEKGEYVFDNMSDKNLEKLLEQAIRIEDFEMAAQIRDILKQRED